MTATVTCERCGNDGATIYLGDKRDAAHALCDACANQPAPAGDYVCDRCLATPAFWFQDAQTPYGNFPLCLPCSKWIPFPVRPLTAREIEDGV